MSQTAEIAGTLQFDPPGPGAWSRDEDHWPRPVPRSYTELYTDAVVPAVQEWTRRYGLLLDHFRSAFPHGFGYVRMVSVGEPEAGGKGPPPKPLFKLLLKVHPELRARRRAAQQALADRLWLDDLRRWEQEVKPAVVAENRANATVDLPELSDEALERHVDRCRDTLRRFLGVHHQFNGGMLPVGLLVDAVSEWGVPVQQVLELFEGASPVSAGRCAELDRLVAALREDTGAQTALFADDEPAAVLDRFGAAGGEVGQAYDIYVRVVGSRLVGDSIEPGNPTLAEVPELLVRTIRAAVEGGSAPADASVRAERAAAVRRHVPQAQRAAFDQLLDDAVRTYRMRDERSVYADVWAAGIFRQALAELGRRLARRERLVEGIHLLEATSAELQALLAGAGPDADELAHRARFRAEHAGASTPANLGGEPAEPPPLSWLPDPLRRMNAAILVHMAGFLHRDQAQPSVEAELTGTPASPGRYQGTARVIVGPEEFGRLEPGDVLVARTTSEAFNVVLPLLGAIVTDRGGALSHAAIVSREAGIPCVVGTGSATATIADGSTVVVDGAAGSVRLRPAAGGADDGGAEDS